MARLQRFTPVGIPQHIIQRGNNRQVSFVWNKWGQMKLIQDTRSNPTPQKTGSESNTSVGIQISLLAKVNHAEEKYLDSDLTVAINGLNAISNQINAQKN